MPTLNRLTAVAASVALGAALLAAGHPAAHAADPVYLDPSQPVPARVADLLARMTLDEKLGQMTMRDAKYPPVSPHAARDQLLGSMLSGGDSAPDPNTPQSWADTYDRYQDAARQTRLGIPLLYGVDAVHGHAGVHGATVFPHNIGLGATRDPDLVQRIGRATATEVAATGVDWTFSPCLCVARDDHWGRVYESFGETPENPSAMTSLITGLQGTSLADRRSIMATAKHYVGDGGTHGGKDQGDTVGDDAALRKIHLPPFDQAVQRNVASVMVSYSSWNGTKMHGNQTLIRDHLRAPRSAGGLGFQGIVVTDWDGAEKVDGQIRYTETDLRTALQAGIDVFMVTDQYGDYINAFRSVVGPHPDASMTRRLDESVRRILTKKFELGLFERRYADRALLAEVGSPAHRALAREAVQKSQVVLKNNGVLPLRDLAGRKLFVAGKSADNIGFQSGGWTIKWQGGDGPITPGTSILQGIRTSAGPDTTVTYAPHGNGIDATYAAAIAVIGEKPYAEGHGDRTDNELGLDPADRAVLATLKASGVPVVTVLASGRPLLLTDELPDMSALVASWLPGSEGQGVADVLFGAVRPTGKLPVSWPRTAAQQPINTGDGKTPLFPYGHGLTYDPVTTGHRPGPTGRNARDTLRAESHTGHFGTRLEPCSDPGCGSAVSYVSPGDHLYLDDVDFGSTSATTVTTRIASGGSSGTIQYRLDQAAGPVVATVSITPTGGWTTWRDVTAPVSNVTGRHRLYLSFTGPGGDFVNVNWFRFS